MNHKRNKKKPPTGRTDGGKGRKQRGHDIFYKANNTNPHAFQTDFGKLADIYSLKSDYYSALADAARLLSILQVSEDRQ